jgi:hypothetical protein
MDVPSGFSPKTFWQRPEGKVGMIFAAILAAAAVVSVGLWVLPFLIEFVVDLTTFILAGAGLAVVCFIVFNPKVHMLVRVIFQSVMRAITGIFITIDPIGILKNYVKRLSKRLDEVDAQNEDLAQQERFLKMRIDANDKKIKESLGLMQAAKATNKIAAARLASNDVTRFTEANKNNKEMLEKVEFIHQQITKVYEACDFMIKDISSEIQVRQDQYRVSNSIRKTIKAATGILRNNGDEQDLYDQDQEYLVQYYADSIGQMEHFMNQTKGFMEKVDLQNDANDAETMRMLDELQKAGENALPAPKQLSQANPGIPVPVFTSVRGTVPSTKSHNYL